MTVKNEIVNKYGLKLSTLIQNTPDKEIYLLRDQVGKRYILKIYKRKDRGFEVEKKFLLAVKGSDSEYLYLPQLKDHGDNYLLMDYVDREHLGRTAAASRNWSKEDVKRWVAGLLEFQRIRFPNSNFTTKQRVFGGIYPIVQLLRHAPKCDFLCKPRVHLKLAKICLLYCLAKTRVPNVLTHYDLQTYNYTFMTTQEKMSLLDFEIPYSKGDPFYDILFFVTIPLMEIRSWTFQKELLREYIRQVYGERSYSKTLLWRIRLILLIFNLQRFLYLEDQKDKSIMYQRNIKMLLSDEQVNTWFLEDICLQHETEVPDFQRVTRGRM